MILLILHPLVFQKNKLNHLHETHMHDSDSDNRIIHMPLATISTMTIIKSFSVNESNISLKLYEYLNIGRIL